MRSLAGAFAASALLTGISCVQAAAQEVPYLDDRSSAASLVESFYNAVNRKEFARAWDYFGDEKPAADPDAFAAGYADTAGVEVYTGAVASEGAAGSTFYHLPVAILAAQTDGSEKVFAGCYVVRLVNPSVQEPPFRPMHIEKGSLSPSDLAFDEALPESCPDAPPPDEADAVLEEARTMFLDLHADCEPGPDGSGPGEDQYTIPFRYSTDADEEPEREARLFRFYCGAGAYNENHVYYQYDETDGLREVSFAVPELDIRYVDDNVEGAVDSIGIIGYTTEATLVNSFYDEATQTITSANKWRGVGDASDSGTWIFRNGRFTLVRYDVDASYDGEINPEPVLDFHTAP
ncbi:DUF1176 domain-containing protein [Mesorhizobium sp. ZMM04-5]|uniref:DUF1176 domain-containing protein n=1 Tax=Mesorhizobium marinum TaxID=3228790 RepID=A0ABV3R4X4_9HYPH